MKIMSDAMRLTIINVFNVVYCLGDLEIELERSVMERVDLQDSLDKMDAAVQQLEQEKKQLSTDMKKVSSKQCEDREHIGYRCHFIFAFF